MNAVSRIVIAVAWSIRTPAFQVHSSRAILVAVFVAAAVATCTYDCTALIAAIMAGEPPRRAFHFVIVIRKRNLGWDPPSLHHRAMQ